MPRVVLLVSLLIGFAAGSPAATYYVDWTNGSDSLERDGSNGAAQSWKTLSYACGRASANDTIRIDASLEYVDEGRCNLAPGVTIKGAGVDSTRITANYASGDGNGYIYRVQTGQTVHRGNNDISGFTLDGNHKTLGAGIWIRGYDHIQIHHMKFQHIKSHAIGLAGYNGWPSFEEGMKAPPPVYGYNNAIHDVTIDDCTTKTTVAHDDRFGAIDLEGLADSQFYGISINENYPKHGTGIKAAPGWLSNVKFYHNTFYNYETDTDCFTMEVYNLVNNSEIYRNNFHHLISLNGGPVQAAGTWNLKIHDNDFRLLSGEGSGNEFSHNNLDMYRNYFHDGSMPAAGLWATNGLTAHCVRNWRFHHNVVYNTSNGIFIKRESSDCGSNNIEVYNNIFDTMTGKPWGGYGFNGEALSGSCQGITVKNNIFRNCAAGPAHLEGFGKVTFDYNLSHGNGNDNKVMGTVAGKHNVVAVPDFAGNADPKLSRPALYYAVTRKASNLRGTGTDVGLPFTGAAPAIGRYEYGEAGTDAGTGKSPAPPAKKPKKARSRPKADVP